MKGPYEAILKTKELISPTNPIPASHVIPH
jgi:hypothetical protein